MYSMFPYRVMIFATLLSFINLLNRLSITLYALFSLAVQPFVIFDALHIYRKIFEML